MPGLSTEALVAIAITVVASIGFVVLGNVYRWDILAPGYALGSRILGALSILGFTATIVSARIERPVSAGLIGLAGVALAAGYVMLHRSLMRRLSASMESTRRSE